MRASEVLDLYAKGKRDFTGVKLKGQCFHGKNLSGANFSKADIRGTNFQGAILEKTKFTEARAGLLKRGRLQLILISWLIAVVCGYMWGLAGYYLALMLVTNVTLFKIIGAVIITILSLIYGIFYRQRVGGLPLVLSLIFGQAISFILAIFISLVFTLLTGIILAFQGALAGIAVMNGTFSIALMVGVCGTLFTAYLAWLSLEESGETITKSMAIAFLASKGTNFCGANLQEADFTGAQLKATDLRAKDLTRTRFYLVSGIERARWEKTILDEVAIRNLLVTGQGENKAYIGYNFRRLNLSGVNFKNANLTRANFSEANLAYANLEGANLAHSNVMRANLQAATLTGACIEAWKIAENTNLEGVDCDYIYLVESEGERRPREGEFGEGEFRQLALEQRKLYIDE
ncbi:pentapeptide repeat family protein [Microcystis sp. 0824]|uniref:pentapeptide repeat-containing protein n=1 Tax=Microcystis sp. 0824 TaxID=1502726 RepID=UPI000D0BF24D|nr:pentapeptide repeat-containing protein [Microcystis sp. 0824]GBF54952.1 pentapeptide repeat family protein [Microcystis sp. 0824]